MIEWWFHLLLVGASIAFVYLVHKKRLLTTRQKLIYFLTMVVALYVGMFLTLLK